MTYLFHILAAVAALAIPSLLEGPASPWRVVSLLPFLLLPYPLARLARRTAIRGRVRVAAGLETGISLFPVALQAGAAAFGGWKEAMNWAGLSVSGSDEWPGLGLLVGLLPFLAASILAIDARARLHAFGRNGLRRARSFQIRMFLSALLPFALYLLLSGIVAWNERVRVEIEEVSLLSAGFTCLLLALFVVTLPRLLTCVWDTVPIPDGVLRNLLGGLAGGRRFRCRDLLLWRTGGQMANAAIVGFTPGTRVVLFTDVLLASLDPLEVAAVFGHEMGHARRRHAVVFAAYAIGVLLAADMLGERYASDDPSLALWILVAALGLWFVSFRTLSRRFELEADLESLDLIGSSVPLLTALRKVTSPQSFHRHSWRHFSTAQRVQFLRAVELRPELGVALRRKLRRWSRAGMAFFLLTACLQAWQLGGHWREEHLVVDLRLGHFEQAADSLAALRVAGDSLQDERIAQQIRVAASLGPAHRTARAIEEAALGAFSKGRARLGGLLLELAILRGAENLRPVLEALQDGSEGASAGDLPEAWRRALANP